MNPLLGFLRILLEGEGFCMSCWNKDKGVVVSESFGQISDPEQQALLAKVSTSVLRNVSISRKNHVGPIKIEFQGRVVCVDGLEFKNNNEAVAAIFLAAWAALSEDKYIEFMKEYDFWGRVYEFTIVIQHKVNPDGKEIQNMGSLVLEEYIRKQISLKKA